MERHPAGFSANLATLQRKQVFLNQQQLQTARAALWHQNAQPLLTGDGACNWLDETGICLFLPRHTQLPAPAPSLVEACMGEPSLTPAAPAIARAMELVWPLIEEGRVIPLNLLGTFSEQPDFLITPEVLRWAAAVRGDRNWKSAPAGRTTPIVLRVWETLEREGEKTAAEIREVLGRELTEGAVLRALIELWNTLRAVPTYVQGKPTRWSLMKSRYPEELTAASNSAQTTALSVLVSLYVRSAVAATAEEIEIFLSPLTARSRIREVVHGMTATRQLGSTTVGTYTVLFVEGSLPETMPEPEQEIAKTGAGSAPHIRAETAPKPRREQQDRDRGERAGKSARDRAWKPRPLRKQEGRDFQRPERRAGVRSAFGTGEGREFRTDQRSGEGKRSGPRPPFRPGDRKESGPKREWQGGLKTGFGAQGGNEGWGEPSGRGALGAGSGDAPRKEREEQGARRGERRRPGAFQDSKQQKPWQRRRGVQGQAPERENRPRGPERREKFGSEGGWKAKARTPDRERPRRENRKPQGEGPRRAGFFGGKKGPRREDRPFREQRPRRNEGPAGQARPPFGSRPTSQDRPGAERPGFAGPGGKRFSRPGSPRQGKTFGGKPSFSGPGKPGKSGSGRSSGGRFGPRPANRGERPGPQNRPDRKRPQGRPFRKPGPPRGTGNPPRNSDPTEKGQE